MFDVETRCDHTGNQLAERTERGPLSTLARKPYANGISTHPCLVTRKATAWATTPTATSQPDVSLTGWEAEQLSHAQQR